MCLPILILRLMEHFIYNRTPTLYWNLESLRESVIFLPLWFWILTSSTWFPSPRLTRLPSVPWSFWTSFQIRPLHSSDLCLVCSWACWLRKTFPDHPTSCHHSQHKTLYHRNLMNVLHSTYHYLKLFFAYHLIIIQHS